MSKRTETIELENALRQQCKEKRIYGCEEVTIGFPRQFKMLGGHQIVDFMTMDVNGIIRCYEIKVTLADLKSSAKKSWFGHYNYLVVSSELYDQVSDWSLYIPSHVGIIRGTHLESQRKAVKQEVEDEINIILKDSLIRTLWWKREKEYDADSLEKKKELEQKLRKVQKEKDSWRDRANDAERLISEFERYYSLNRDIDFIDFEEEVRKEKERYKEKERRKNVD